MWVVKPELTFRTFRPVSGCRVTTGCRVRWEPNTLTLWDNRCTQHQAVWDYYPFSRYGERVSVLGDAAPGPAVPAV